MERETIKEEIKEIYEKSNKVYGAPKITKELEKKGRGVSQKTISKYMKAMDLRAIWVRKYKASRREKVEDELKDILKRGFNPPTKISRSYSRKGNPWDNAVIESFHSLIKREWLNRYRIRDLREARGLIFEYIETFYNRRRIHSYCGMLSPDEFEKNFKKYSA